MGETQGPYRFRCSALHLQSLRRFLLLESVLLHIQPGMQECNKPPQSYADKNIQVVLGLNTRDATYMGEIYTVGSCFFGVITG